MAAVLRTTLWSGLGAAVFGTLLGLATTGGIRTPAQAADPIYPRSSRIADPAWQEASVAECAGCTRYDEGYRWAGSHAITDADACFGDDWSHQRGCLAYVAGTRLD